MGLEHFKTASLKWVHAAELLLFEFYQLFKLWEVFLKIMLVGL